MEAWGAPGLFLSGLLAATLLPLSSEAVMTGMVLSGQWDPWLLWGAATLGNGLGSTLNWALGRYALHFQGRRWFPLSANALENAARRFQTYGRWSLLFAWLPLVGDPLTMAAGLLRTPLGPFLLLVFTGKGARYAALLLLLEAA